MKNAIVTGFLVKSDELNKVQRCKQHSNNEGVGELTDNELASHREDM